MLYLWQSKQLAQAFENEEEEELVNHHQSVRHKQKQSQSEETLKWQYHFAAKFQP